MWMYLFFTVHWGILWKWMSHYTHTELTSNCVGFPVWVVSCASPILPCQYYCAIAESTKWHWQKCRGWHMRLLAAATYHSESVCIGDVPRCPTHAAVLFSPWHLMLTDDVVSRPWSNQQHVYQRTVWMVEHRTLILVIVSVLQSTLVQTVVVSY